MKKVFKSKLFYFVIVLILLAGIIVFPHTKTTKSTGELSGVYVTVKETYLLHQLIELETTNVCMGTFSVRVSTVSYRLNGDIKSTFSELCNLSTNYVEYNTNGTIKMSESTSVGLLGIDITTTEYNEFGQVLSINQKYAPSYSEISNEYSEENMLVKQTTLSFKYNDLTFEIVEQFDDGQLTEIEYEDINDGVVANIECVDGACILVSLSTDDYSVLYNTVDEDYDFTNKSDNSQVNIYFTQITENNYEAVISEIKLTAEYMLDTDS